MAKSVEWSDLPRGTRQALAAGGIKNLVKLIEKIDEIYLLPGIGPATVKNLRTLLNLDKPEKKPREDDSMIKILLRLDKKMATKFQHIEWDVQALKKMNGSVTDAINRMLAALKEQLANPPHIIPPVPETPVLDGSEVRNTIQRGTELLETIAWRSGHWQILRDGEPIAGGYSYGKGTGLEKAQRNIYQFLYSE